MIQSIKAQFSLFFKTPGHPGGMVVRLATALAFMLLAGAGLASPATMDETRLTRTAAEKCDRQLYGEDRSRICLRKRQDLLVRLSADGKTLVSYGGRLQRPSLFAINRTRVAVIDRNGLQVFAWSGELLYRYQQLREADAMSYHQDKLYVVDGDRLLVFNDARLKSTDFQPRLLELPDSKTDFLAADAAGNVYRAHRRQKYVSVHVVGVDQPYQIRPAGLKRIKGLATDAGNTLYVLMEDNQGQHVIAVFRGLQQRFRFPVADKLEARGLSATATGADTDTLVSIYDRRAPATLEIRYNQVPGRVNGVSVIGYPDKVQLQWEQSVEPFVADYVVFASETVDGVYEPVGSSKTTHLLLSMAGKRHRFFKVGARARSGLQGPLSGIAENGFEAGFQEFKQVRYAQAADLFRKHRGAASTEYLARSLLKQGQNDLAMVVAARLQSMDGYQAIAKGLLAEAFFENRQYRLADDILSTLNHSQLIETRTLMLCAKIKLKLGQKQQALRCLREARRQQPASVAVKLAMLEVLDVKRDQKQRTGIIKDLAKTAARDKNDSIPVSLGQYYLGSGNLSSAGRWFQQALKISKTSAGGREGLVEVYLRQKKRGQARGIALKMIQVPEQQARGYLRLGQIAMAQARPGEAVYILRKGLATQPDDPDLLLVIAQAYRDLGNHQQARQSLEKLFDRDRNNYAGLKTAIVLEQALGNEVKAQAYLEKLCRHYPQDREAQLMFASQLEKTGQLWRATRYARAADALHADMRSGELLARLHFKRGQSRKALHQYSKLLKKKPHSSKFRMRIADIFISTGKFRQARKTLEKLIRNNHRNKPALSRLIQVYRELGMINSAIRSAKSLVAIDKQPQHQLMLNSLLAEKTRAVKTGGKQALTIKAIQLNPVVTTALDFSEPPTIAQLTLANSGKRTLTELWVKAYIDNYSGQNIETQLDALAPGEQQTVSLTASFQSMVERINSDVLLPIDIEVSYKTGTELHIIEKRRALQVYGRNAIDWQSRHSVGRFVSTSLSLPPTGQPGTPASLSGIYAWLQAQGIAVAEREKTNVPGYVQLPTETLDSKQGSTEDIGILFASLLRSNGHDIALLKTDKHLLVLLADDHARCCFGSAEARKRLLLRYKQRDWVPLYMHGWSKGIAAMWQQGLDVLAQLPDANGWLVLEGKSAGKEVANRQRLDTGPIDRPMYDWLVSGYQLDLLRLVWRQMQVNSLDTAGVLMGERLLAAGEPDLAGYAFRQLLAREPDGFRTAIGLGAASALEQRISSAIDYYSRATAIRPFEASGWHKLAELLDQAGQDKDARAALTMARLLDRETNPGNR